MGVCPTAPGSTRRGAARLSPRQRRGPHPPCCQVFWLPYHHCGHVTLLSGPLPLVHLELSEDVEEWVLPHWGDREVWGTCPRGQTQGGAGVWVCTLPSSDSNQSASTGFGPKIRTNPPEGLRLALTKPGRRLSAHRAPDPARPPSGSRTACPPGLRAASLPRAMAQPLALRLHFPPRPPRAPRRARSARLATAAWQRRHFRLVDHVTSGRNFHLSGAEFAVWSLAQSARATLSLSQPGAGAFVPRFLRALSSQDPIGGL